MDHVRVRSSNIASVGYDATSATLEIQFNDGAVYQYAQVPEQLYRGLIGSGSVGGYFTGTSNAPIATDRSAR